MNRAPYADAKILIAGQNVGCGSSREPAVWALHEYGFRAVIAPSINPLFRGNCIRNGIVTVQLAAEEARTLGDDRTGGVGGKRVSVRVGLGGSRSIQTTTPTMKYKQTKERKNK